ncbi:MAG: PqqD family protein [Clostridia bacterium]|nr:PqqD family protein [Clostridia bacterium]
MKIKSGFILREMSGDEQGTYIVVAVGEASKNLSGYLTLNETGAFIWKMLEKGATEEETALKICEEYDAPICTVSNDVKCVIETLEKIGALDV